MRNHNRLLNQLRAWLPLSSGREVGGRSGGKSELAAGGSRVDESPGWAALTGRPHDYDPAQVQELYLDALTAWRKNPIAWRIIAITTDYVVGDQVQAASPHRALNRFIRRFWNHPQNRMPLRLEAMCDELSRSGDLFILLFRNPQDGMSYLRFLTKDQVARIETAPNDWETELAYVEREPLGGERVWLSPHHPDAAQAEAICLHYAVNRPVGALLGESDLTTMLPWLQRYSRMLEDRVRLNWATRAFLWFVTVPANRVREKQEQYRTPPEAGAIVVKDDSESWQVAAPSLHAIDASRDLQAVRGMIDAGSGYPPHWRGEAGDANLATATAMQGPTERHLLRRQQYFRFLLQDLLYQAYQRAAQLGRTRPLPPEDLETLISVEAPDISRWDNEALARAGRDLAGAWGALGGWLGSNGAPAQGEDPARSAPDRAASPTLQRLVLRMLFRFTGEPLSEAQLEQIMQELGANPIPPAGPPAPPDTPPTPGEAPTPAGEPA